MRMRQYLCRERTQHEILMAELGSEQTLKPNAADDRFEPFSP